MGDASRSLILLLVLIVVTFSIVGIFAILKSESMSETPVMQMKGAEVKLKIVQPEQRNLNKMVTIGFVTLKIQERE